MSHFVNEILENIWKDRYQKNNETYKENLERVARYCSKNMLDYHDFMWAMEKRYFFPAGRTMSNSGIGKNLTLNNCFSAGTKIITKDGLKNIEDVEIGDYVLTENNTYERVNNVSCRNYEGDLYVIDANGIYAPIICTPNHMFLTNNGWKRADRLLYHNPSQKYIYQDRLKVPYCSFEKKYEDADITIGFECENKKIEINGNKCRLKVYQKNRINYIWTSQGYEVNRYLKFTKDFRYFIGRWLGDGSITRYKGKRNHSILQIVFNADKEKNAAERCAKIGTEIFGFEPDSDKTNQNVIALRWCNEIIAKWFYNNFGEKCNGKYLSEKYKGDFEIAKGLLDADCCINAHGAVSITLKNKNLIEWLNECLFLNGFNTLGVQKVKNLEDTYKLTVSTYIGKGRLNKNLSKTYYDKRCMKNYTDTSLADYVKIKNISILENQNTKVYNLSVENYHSYTANGVVVHNCFIAPQIRDDLSDIFSKVALGARTHQKGGGIGYDFSQLRPKGFPTSNDAIASGAVSFMDVFNAQTSTILQGSRRGANMGVMSVYNMDIEEFINAKSYDENKLVHFNVSVMVDDDFINAVKENKDIFLHYPVYNENGTLEKNPDNWIYSKKESARKIWDLIIKKAYDNGEPGIFFYDNMNKDNNLWYIENIVCSNPCAEYLGGTVYGTNPITGEKLKPEEFGGACNLGSIFLHNFVINPFTANATIDYENLKKTINIAVRFLDNIIDINKFPDPIYENYQKAFRTIGLGITGLADMLIMMNMAYNSKEAQFFTNDLMNFIVLNAYKASINLAKERGAFPFLKTKDFINSGFIQKHLNVDKEWHSVVEDIEKFGIRNSKIISVAPTGTLSLTYGNNCSSGLEPIFSLEYERKVKIGGQTDDKIKIVKMRDYAYGEWLKVKDEPDTIVTRDKFVTAMDMTVDEHIDMLGIIAFHVDMSCSKTINVPTEYSFEDTKKIYMRCHDLGIKGCTIFRPNEIRQGIMITDNNKTDDKNDKNKSEIIDTVSEKKNTLKRGDIIVADDNCIGLKRTLITGCGTLHCEAFFDPDTGDLLETYFSKGSSGGCVDADTEYFNGQEWKKISNYKRGSYEKVLQYNESGVAELVEPINYIVNDGITSLNHFTNHYGLDMVLSDDHRMFVYKNYRKYSMGIRNKLTTEILSVSDYLKSKKERHIPTTFTYKANGIPLTNEEIRLLVAVYADGRYDGHKINVGLIKDRKKDRLRTLLKKCNVGWSERDVYNTKYTYFYFYPIPSIQEWFIDKQFTNKWYDCTDSQLEVIIDECVYWDGSAGKENRLGEYYSSKKDEIDFIQLALHRLGYRATISLNNSSNSDKPSYRVRWTKQNVHNLKYSEVSKYQTVDNRSYCFTVPSGLLVLRRNGKIFITGNCNNFMIGLSRMISLSARGGIDIYSIVDQLQSSGTCPSYAVRSATKHDTSKGSCCPVAVGNALLDMYKEMQNTLFDLEEDDEIHKDVPITKVTQNLSDNRKNKKSNVPTCPECGEPLIFEGGCNICKSCGWSKCS